jgi:hypothetical protein
MEAQQFPALALCRRRWPNVDFRREADKAVHRDGTANGFRQMAVSSRPLVVVLPMIRPTYAPDKFCIRIESYSNACRQCLRLM